MRQSLQRIAAIGGNQARYTEKILSVGLPLFWHRADMETYQTVGGVVAGNGDPVGSWLDQSTNDRDVTATTTTRPVLRTGEINGLPALEFDGSNDGLLFPASVDNSTLTLFMVLNRPSAGPATYQTSFTTDKCLFLARAATTDFVAIFFNGPAATTFSIGTNYVINGFVVRNFNDVDVRVNGVKQTITTLSGYSNVNVTNYGLGVGSPARMKLAEAICFAGTLNRSQISVIEQALAERYNVSVTSDVVNGLLVAGDSKSTVIPELNYVPELITGLAATGRNYELLYRVAVGGITVAGLRAQLEAVPPNTNDYITECLINIGINNISDGALTDITTDLAWIVETLHTAYPLARIFLMRVGRDATGHATWPAKLTTLNDTYIANVISAHSSYCFAGPDERVWMEGGDNYATYTSDGVHTNVAGRAVCAAQWQTAMGY